MHLRRAKIIPVTVDEDISKEEREYEDGDEDENEEVEDSNIEVWFY